ncbi:MAG: hypothetical protein BroJett042_06010 [Bacteroidota bacterium]|nr:MAG: hypothetical protein UZ12_BCD005003335 [Bacteroidetes bacterium OLB12]QLH33049.1 MAG: hypothetical protein HWD62_12045 [Cyclobacteriaceae bacterium]GIL22088.1 MAG: hypothetical protein BroJett042_06010 [Bacteroidota bacterium]HNR75240.1 hypothetical protein [Cyclobacteriaceae bacterium]HNU41637.1 hypothetical protein [Cyclobacteriaceae bacterium]
MQRSSSTSTVFIILILLLTFPLWVGLGAGLFGLIAGLFAGLVGLIVGLIGAVVGIIAAIFKALFGWGAWHHGWHFDGPDMNAFTWFALLIIGALIITRNRKSKS